MKVEKIAIAADMRDGLLKVRLVGPGFRKGYQSVAGVSLNNAAAMAELRKDAAERAKQLGVPFADVTLH